MTSILSNKTVLVTGHTGFKGSWLCIWLRELGARVIGYALEPHTPLDNFVVSGLRDKVDSNIGDIRDYDKLESIFDNYHPEIVFHLAAQPIVRLSYDMPRLTYDTNLIGTVNVLDCCRLSDSVKVIINVTSDKCYENKEWVWGYRENDVLGGHDPYSSSKACSEIITSAYRDSFFKDKYVSTVRAGNVIGGGDWQFGRIVPDCIKSLKQGNSIGVRNLLSVRPWQFVLEPLKGYIMLAEKMCTDGGKYSGAWNFAPGQCSTTTVKELVTRIIHYWGSGSYTDLSGQQEQLVESRTLSLDISKSVNMLGWSPVLSIDEAVRYTTEWYKNPGPDYEFCVNQIREYSKVI
jgi:CDP-glucose 4,6-dehydratase